MLAAALESFSRSFPEHVWGHDQGRDAIIDAHLEAPSLTKSYLVKAGFLAVAKYRDRNREYAGTVPDVQTVAPESVEFNEFLAKCTEIERDAIESVLHLKRLDNKDLQKRLHSKTVREFRKSPGYQAAKEFLR